jgi:hypothetical protein
MCAKSRQLNDMTDRLDNAATLGNRDIRGFVTGWRRARDRGGVSSASARWRKPTALAAVAA